MKHSRRSRAERREEAEERNAQHAKRTPKEQMSLVRTRRGDSIRERERLIERIEVSEAH